MPVAFWIIYTVISVGLYALAHRAFGAPMSLALMISVLVHEGGHYVWLKLCGIRSVLFVTPYVGACLPLDNDPAVALTSFSKGWLYLSGCGVSLVWAAAIYMLLASPVGRHLPGPREFWSALRLIPLFMNLLNLLALLPITDGGRCCLLILSGRSLSSTRLLASLGMIQGIYAVSLLDLTGCVIFGTLSLLLLRSIWRHGVSDGLRFGVMERLGLLGGWLFIVGGSVALLLTHSFTRWHLMSMYDGFITKLSLIFL